jgi:hypothetical protein
MLYAPRESKPCDEYLSVKSQICMVTGGQLDADCKVADEYLRANLRVGFY